MIKAKVGHAEMRLGDSMIMLGQARDQWKPRPANFYLYVEDVDAVYKRGSGCGREVLAGTDE